MIKVESLKSGVIKSFVIIKDQIQLELFNNKQKSEFGF